MTLYYSIHGSEKDGYSLLVYKYVKSKREKDADILQPYWYEKKHYKTLKELFIAIEEVSNEI